MVTRKTSARARSQKTDRFGTIGAEADVEALVQAVLRESYQQTTGDLKYYAEKLKHFNEQKKAVRRYLQALRCVKDKFLAAARK
jgi:hypothetical protein